MSYVLSNIKWGSSTPDSSGGQVTWSFAKYQTRNSSWDWDGQISESAYRELVRDAFDAWEAVADIDFVEVTDDGNGNSDIRLGWDYIDGTSNTIGQAYQSYYLSSSGFDTYDYAEIRFDTSETWSGNKNDVGGNANFYAVALHEIGHAIGLDHSPDSSTVMYYLTGGATDLTSSDIAGARAIYGPAEGGTGGVPGGGGNGLIGTSGADHLYGTSGNDLMIGHDGDDTIEGGAGNDAIWAGANDTGNDFVYGGSGNDTIGGGAGADMLSGGSGADFLFGGLGRDRIFTGNEYTPTSDGSSVLNVAWGGDEQDVLRGDETRDILGGGAGNDMIDAGGGSDTLYGGQGAASTNSDELIGSAGDDIIYGGNGDDVISGDGISGDAGDDLLFGGAGNDQVYGDDGEDEIWGGSGDDQLTGGYGADVFGFVNGSGADTIHEFDFFDDAIDLSGYSGILLDFVELQAGFIDSSDRVTIMLDGGDTIALLGRSSSDLDASDFIL